MLPSGSILLFISPTKKYLDHLSDYIENTSVFGWNQEEGRAYHIPEAYFPKRGLEILL